MRSNRILERLQMVARPYPDLREALRALPLTLVAAVGEARVAIVHGDAQSLAGWGFARESLSAPQDIERIARWFRQSKADIFASSHTCAPLCRSFSHTCAPLCRSFSTPEKPQALINNGAAGIPNFASSHFGVASRISTRPCELKERLYGLTVGDVYVDAIALHYDHAA